MKKIILISIVLIIIFCIFYFDLNQLLNLENFQAHLGILQKLYSDKPIIFLSIFFFIYVAITATSLPAATVLTLGAGALFGTLYGTIIVSFASTLGATIAFLTSRYILQSSIENKYSKILKTINAGIEKEGIFYLFTLRLIPFIPFFLINLIFGITKISIFTFYWVSQLGMLIGTVLYVHAGAQLATIESTNDILSPRIILALTALGVVPLLLKKIIGFIKLRKIYAPYKSKKPKKFQYNTVVIGAGSAGLISSYILATVKAKVAIIEKSKTGGDCLNSGCVPSKALIRCAHALKAAKESAQFGVTQSKIEFSFKDAKKHVQNTIAAIAPNDSFERYESLGVKTIAGEAKITSPWTVEVGEKVLTTQNIVIACGASPAIPKIPGIEAIPYLTSDNIWQLDELPKNLTILGGGPIGSELAQCFAFLGSKVRIIEMSDRIMAVEDVDVSEAITKRFEQDGIEILVNHTAKIFKKKNYKNVLICDHKGKETEIEFEHILIAVGRKANTNNFGIEELKITLRKNGSIEVNEYLQTNYPNIYACGDITGPYQFTHMASYQAQVCAANSLFGHLKKTRVSYAAAVWCTFTYPEIATTGLSEQSAKKEKIPYELTKYEINHIDRARTDKEDMVFIKVLTVPGKNKILGATIVGAQASNLIIEFVSAIKNDFGLNEILQTIHVYPSLSLANQEIAGAWKKKHTSKKLLHFLGKYFKWSRA